MNKNNDINRAIAKLSESESIDRREAERGILTLNLTRSDSLQVSDRLRPGLHPFLGTGAARDGLIFVPESDTNEPRPALLLLHGAGGSAHGMVMSFKDLAADLNLILIVPESRSQTWDIITGGYGPDVRYIDRALHHVIARVAIDPTRLSIGGFSDGASYALSLGVVNGEIFSRIIAFSPGFAMPTRRRGEPRLYISHGRTDRVLDIDQCSRRLVPALESAGFDITYKEFDGGHNVPDAIAEEAFAWAAGRTRLPSRSADPAV